MSSFGGLAGLNGGAGGTGFAGPSAAGLTNPVSGAQLNTAYGQNQTALGNQNSLLSALQAQNGIQNQSNVYGQLQGIASGNGPNPAQAQLNQATGANVANQAALMAGQRGSSQNAGLIARQAAQQGAATQQQAAGQGASMQAQQSLGALGQMGGIAGAQTANQIGQTNANTSAQQAEQANLLNAAGGFNTAQVGMQSNINNVNGQLANTQLQGQQALAGGLMQGLSGSSMMSSMGGAEGGKVTKQGFQRFDDGGEVSDAPSGGDNMPQDDVSSASAPDEAAGSGDFGDFKGGVQDSGSVNASTPSFGSDAGAASLGQGAAAASGKSSSGGGGGMSSMMGLLAMMADGGDPGNAPQGAPAQTQDDPNEPKSKFGKYLKNGVKDQKAAEASAPEYGNSGANALYKGVSALTSKAMGNNQQSQQTQGPNSQMDRSGYSGSGFDPQQMNQEALQNQAAQAGGIPMGSPDLNAAQYQQPQQPLPAEVPDTSDEVQMAKGGKVPALVSPGEQYLKPKDVKEVMKSGKSPLTKGERIPGKPKHPGNDYRNDTVPKTLEAGGIVIPNKIMQGPNPHWEALKFVSATIKKNKHK